MSGNGATGTPTDPQRERIAQIFDQLLDGADFDALLAAERDTSVAAGVRRLWKHHISAAEEKFLDAPVEYVPLPVFEVGQILAGRFTIESFLGAGGMGEVYLAHDGKLAGQVAIKTITRFLSNSETIRRRFFAEIQNARRVTHPNICRIYDLFEEGRTPFYAMEFLPGSPLSSFMDNPPWPLAERRRLLIQLAQGLQAAHQSGVVHGDFKPSNVMLTGQDPPQAVIMDFGLAAAFDQSTGDLRQKYSIEAGTIGFMSPELQKGAAPTISSDIYAFGKVASLVLPGERLWEKCVDPDPARRPASLDDIIRWLNPRPVSRRYWIGGLVLTAAAAATVGRLALSPLRVQLEPNARLFVNGLQSLAAQFSQARLVRSLLLTGLRQSPRLRTVQDQDLMPLLRQVSSADPTTLPVNGNVLHQILQLQRAAYWLEGNLVGINGRFSLVLHLFRVSDSNAVDSIEFRDVPSLALLAEKGAFWLRSLAGESSRSLSVNPASAAAFSSSVPEALETYYQAMDHYALGQMDEAIPLLSEAVRLDPNFAQAHSVLGMCMNFITPSEEALSHVLRAHDLAAALPEREKAWIESNFAQLTENPAGMIDAARKCLDFFPDEPRFYRIYAHVLCWTGRPRDAIALSRKCVELSPGNDLNLSELIVHLSNANLYTEAASEYEKAVAAGAKNPYVPYKASVAYAGLRQYQRAAELAGRLPADPEWLSLPPRLLSGDLDGAAAYLEQKAAEAQAAQNALELFGANAQLCGVFFLAGRQTLARQRLLAMTELAEVPRFAHHLQCAAFWAGQLADDAMLALVGQKVAHIQRHWDNSFTRAVRMYVEALQAKRQNDGETHINLLIQSTGSAPTLWPFFDLPCAYMSMNRHDLAEEFWQKFSERHGAVLCGGLGFSGLIPLGYVRRAQAAEAREDWAAVRTFAGYVQEDWSAHQLNSPIAAEAHRLFSTAQNRLIRRKQ